MDIIREDCIYARQSVDRKDSISIESQIDFCKYELKGGSCRVFKDKGYSGKNTDRPEFQKLLGEIRKGKVRRVIVYKLDRISRSILDFANMMELFQEYDVEFVSSTEKFDTSTPMGRAMLNICIVFAQLERETIQKRVTDAYYSRCLKGFHMSGQAPYGYQLEPTVVDGIRTKKMVADPAAADHVRLMFEMYAEPGLPSETLPATLRNRALKFMANPCSVHFFPSFCGTRFTHRLTWNCTSSSRARARPSSTTPPTSPEQTAVISIRAGM